MSRALKLDRRGKLVVPEASLEAAIFTLLSWDDWHVFRFGYALTEAKRELGEISSPDLLAIRYEPDQVLWIEAKSKDGRADEGQKLWHIGERRRGATVWVAGDTFPATTEGFLAHYRTSGFMERPI